MVDEIEDRTLLENAKLPRRWLPVAKTEKHNEKSQMYFISIAIVIDLRLAVCARPYHDLE